ncbi:MAG: sugar phosphate isomerase/epimerase [Bacteroidales bacterium]|nr:sugar phosphate isomerase/epimerase [Bacteroidales bacterium]
MGLIPFSNHVPFAEMMNDLDRVIADNTVLGVQYIVFPYMDAASRPGVDPDQFRQTVARIGEIGTKVRDAGFQLLYHNHDFEFAKLPDGTVGHDYIFSATDRKQLQMELDVCWADYAGFNPAQRLLEFSGYIPVVHLKDYAVEGELDGDPYALIGQEPSQAAGASSGKFEFRPLGDGCMDMLAVIRASAEGGARWLCVEQDEPVAGAADRFEGPARSMEYLRKLGLR